jgi:hypothetical protein
MPREDWQDREDDRRRAAIRERDDYGQADYSSDYAYDPDRGGYRRYGLDDPEYARRMDEGDYRRPAQPRSWMDRASGFFSGAPRSAEAEVRARRRRGPSDRVLWVVIVERLEDERGLDLRGVEVVVEDGEVFLNGRVHRKADKRRIEDIADIDGVRHVQNNLRVHDRGAWTFL